MIERSAPKWPAVVASLSEFASYSAADKELGGIRRTAKVQTDWLDSPQIRADLKAGAFDFATLKEKRTTVYLVPAGDEAHPLRSEWKLTGKMLRYRQDRHILSIGPNGSGKTHRLLFPDLHPLKNWSIVAIDPKGELFAYTRRLRHAAFATCETPP